MRSIFNFGVPGLYEELSPALRGLLDTSGTIIKYADGQLIQTRGDKTRGFSIIKSGAVCFGKTDAEGRFITSVVYEPGQCYGEFTVLAGLPRTHDGIAVGETSICHISKATFDRLLADEPALAAPILASLTLRLHSLLEWADDLRRYPLKVRLGKQLLALVRAPAKGTASSLTVTQGDLAELMGVSRVAVAKILADYQRRGFVRLGYGKIEITNPNALEIWLQQFVQLDPISAAKQE